MMEGALLLVMERLVTVLKCPRSARCYNEDRVHTLLLSVSSLAMARTNDHLVSCER